MANKENLWDAVQIGSDDSAEACALLPELARNEIAAIKIGQFLCEKELDAIKANMEDKTIAWYDNKTGQQGRIGINTTGFSHLSDGKKNTLTQRWQPRKIEIKYLKASTVLSTKYLSTLAMGLIRRLQQSPS